MYNIDSELGLDKTVESAMAQQLGEQGLDVAIVKQDEDRGGVKMPNPNPSSSNKNLRVGLITLGVIAGIIYFSMKK